MAPASRTKAEALVREPSLEDRFDHETDSLLHDAILDGWNAQRSRLAVALWDVHALDSLRPVRTLPQCRRQLGKVIVLPRCEPFNALPIHARRTFVRTDLCPCGRQRLGREHLVYQTEPLTAFDAVDQRRSCWKRASSTRHPFRPHLSFGPRNHGTGLCIVRSRCRHSRCCLCFSPGRHASTFLPTFPRRGFASRASRDPFGRDHISTMRALTPDGLAHARRVSPLALLCLPDIPPPTTQCKPSVVVLTSSRSIRPHDPGFATNEQARPCTSPKRIRHPTGCPFASGCSPPRIAATQLPSAT